jgi:hypothetical protein
MKRKFLTPVALSASFLLGEAQGHAATIQPQTTDHSDTPGTQVSSVAGAVRAGVVLHRATPNGPVIAAHSSHASHSSHGSHCSGYSYC